jgi:hypothetical protein
MRDKINIIVFILACVAFYIYLREANKPPEPYLLSYELTSSGKDTINKVDLKGLRQGLWYVYRYNGPDEQIEGRWIDSVGTFKDGKKEGYWIKCGIEGQDSMRYSGCRLVFDQNRTYTFTVPRNIIFADTAKTKRVL